MASNETPDSNMDDISNVTSISAAAAAYQAAIAMSQTTINAQAEASSEEVAENLDLPPAQPIAAAPTASTPTPSSTPAPPTVAAPAISTSTPSQTPAPRTGTPARMDGTNSNSRATSQHPEPSSALPAQAAAHGAVTRQYLNGVAGPVREGMKQLAVQKPAQPLKFLGEYLLRMSKELGEQ